MFHRSDEMRMGLSVRSGQTCGLISINVDRGEATRNRLTDAAARS